MVEIFPLSRPGNAAFDWWSLVHTASGAALGVVVGRWWVALACLLAYELLEAALRNVKRKGKGLFEHESWPNIFTDVVVGMAGWAAVAFLVPLPDSWHWA